MLLRNMTCLFGSHPCDASATAREDFRGVAVLSLTDDGEGNLNPLPPCGVCSEWLEKIVEVRRAYFPYTLRCWPLRTPDSTPLCIPPSSMNG